MSPDSSLQNLLFFFIHSFVRSIVHFEWACICAFGRNDALIRHLLIEIAANIYWPYLTYAGTIERQKKNQQQQHPNEFIYYCSIFYAIQFIACYLSSAGTIFAFSLSCLFIFALKHARHVHQNVTSQCKCKMQNVRMRFICTLCCVWYCIKMISKANEKPRYTCKHTLATTKRDKFSVIVIVCRLLLNFLVDKSLCHMKCLILSV